MAALIGRIRFLAAAALVLRAGHLYAQDLDTLIANSDLLTASISLDRTVHFPSEAAYATITVQNLTANSLQVFAPFYAATGCLDVFDLSLAQPPKLPGPESACTGIYVDSGTPTTTFAPGEQRQMTLASYDDMFDSGLLVMASGSVPRDPGYYQLTYREAAAAFEVVIPHLDAAALVQVQDYSVYNPATGQNEVFHQYMHAFALRWKNTSYICVTQAPTSDMDLDRTDANGNFIGDTPAYLRIATSQNPIVSIRISADNAYNLTVSWQDSMGGRGSMDIGTAPAPPSPGTVQIGRDITYIGVEAAGTQQFTPTIIGSGNANVNWSVALGTDAPAGSPTGAVSATGLYSAPGSVSAPYSVILTAQSQADPTKSAIAMIVLSPPVSVSLTSSPPAPVTVCPNNTVNFTATVTNAPNKAVGWAGSGNPPVGDLAIDGNTAVYTPPVVSSNQSITITVTSQFASTKTASKVITVFATCQ